MRHRDITAVTRDSAGLLLSWARNRFEMKARGERTSWFNAAIPINLPVISDRRRRMARRRASAVRWLTYREPPNGDYALRSQDGASAPCAQAGVCGHGPRDRGEYAAVCDHVNLAKRDHQLALSARDSRCLSRLRRMWERLLAASTLADNGAISRARRARSVAGDCFLRLGDDAWPKRCSPTELTTSSCWFMHNADERSYAG